MRPVARRDSSVASFTRWASPPDRVVAVSYTHLSYSSFRRPCSVSLPWRVLLYITSAEDVYKRQGQHGLPAVAGGHGPVEYVVEIALNFLHEMCIRDREEIVRIARHIGTFETSILPYEDCCTVFTPRHPKTRPHVEEVQMCIRDRSRSAAHPGGASAIYDMSKVRCMAQSSYISMSFSR